MPSYRLRHALSSLFGLALLSLAGCGGSGGSTSVADSGTCSAAASENCAPVLVGLTDAEGDFVNYEVTVNALQLERADGSSVEVLPASTRIDFAQVTSLTEIVSAALVPPGVYVGGSIDLDFTSADVHVQGANGEILQATVVGADGAPLGATSLEIRLDAQHPLVLTRRRAALLTFDFDLAASNSVDTSVDPAIVTAAPYVAAQIAPLEQKELRVRGVLDDVDTAASSYTVRVRPWHLPNGDFGRTTVHTSAETTYEIGDQVLVGDAGLAALADAGAGTLTVAFGTYDLASRTFTASVVHAGGNVAGINLDTVYGHVVARSGNSLSVEGAYLVRPDHAAGFRTQVQIDVDAATRVTRLGDAASLDAQAISVGQRIVAFGNFGTSPADPSAAPVLEASHVRLMVTRLTGRVVATLPGQLDLSLDAIDALGIEHFDFAGTGTATGVDADPANYEVATAGLPLDALAVGEHAAVLGYVSPFGAAPPDFSGQSLIGQRELAARLGIGWGEAGTAAPFLSLDPSGLALDLANPDIGERHYLLLGAERIDVTTLGGLTLLPAADRPALYGIWSAGHVELFADFNAFVAELERRLGGGERARALFAAGRYDTAAGTLEAHAINAELAPVSP